MKRKIVFFNQWCLLGSLCYYVFMLGLSICITDTTKMLIAWIVLDVINTVGIIFFWAFASGHMVLYDDGLKTKLKGYQKYTFVELQEIKEVVVNLECLYSKTGLDLSLRLNSKNGVLLGHGNRALRALMKKYPNIKFRVPYLGLRLFRSNVRMLGKRGCIGKYNAKLYAKLYHLPPDFAQKPSKQDDVE